MGKNTKFFVERPHRDFFLEKINEFNREEKPFAKGKILSEAYDFLCSHYEEYIESLLSKNKMLELNSETLLAEVIATKQLVKQLVDKIGD